MSTMNASQSKAFMQQYFAVLEKWREYDMMLAQRDDNEEILVKMEEMQIKLNEMRDKYEDNLPVLPLSRCPFSNEVVYHSIDPYGLEGLWWNYDAPVRKLENLPAAYFALDGAVTLQGQVESAPFLCKPGAGVPAVLPRLLNIDGIKAVISLVPIGTHQGYAIFYFASHAAPGLIRVNTWGSRQYTFIDSQNMLRWGESSLSIDDYDFELGKWIESGKLLWIKPGDESLDLHSSAGDCPYVGLQGNRELQRIERGKVWSGESY